MPLNPDVIVSVKKLRTDPEDQVRNVVFDFIRMLTDTNDVL